MSVPVIKICGLCHPDDVRCAVEAGATHVGFVFAPGRRRTVDLSLWLEMMDASGDAYRVGVFQGNDLSEIALLSEMWALSAVQLHGGYSSVDVATWHETAQTPVWWAQQPECHGEVWRVPVTPATASLVVLDSAHSGHFGGTGAALPWQQIERPQVPFLVAGGLTAHNVREAVRCLQPLGVDTSSGVEDPAKAPRKSHDAIRAFVAEAKHALVSRETGADSIHSSADQKSGQHGDSSW